MARVLVAVDDDTARAVVTADLRRAGHLVVDVDSALRALDVIVERSTMPEIAVLDIGLPDMDCFELVRALREHPRMVGLQVIILAARMSGHDLETVRSLGCTHLTTPVTGSALLVAIERSTRRPRPRDAAGCRSRGSPMIPRRGG